MAAGSSLGTDSEVDWKLAPILGLPLRSDVGATWVADRRRPYLQRLPASLSPPLDAVGIEASSRCSDALEALGS